MLHKIKLNLTYNKQRDRNLITPCCKKHNKDGKFVSYIYLAPNFGYCHSCGKATLPQTRYKDDLGNEYVWNNGTKKMELAATQFYDYNALQMHDHSNTTYNSSNEITFKTSKYIDFNIVKSYYNKIQENNLLLYLRKKYGNTKTEMVKKMYYIGTSKDMGTIFWNINREEKAQKAKVSYYNLEGRRADFFKVPYKNADGYYSCLFGEQLIDRPENKDKAIILVESEKTAIVCAMFFPDYIWLAYGGITALTNDKIKVLVGRKVILIPDMSEKAVEIMNKKLMEFEALNIDAKVWDLTEGKSDDELRMNGWYNADLEDVLRKNEQV